MIRTPDRRLRVFVSSTLVELAEERRAARAAIERLASAPVMFELGARPHPPRALYRSYLEQSDLFVGIYWERYGWVAPGEAVSGLEDEYDLVPAGMPRLIYIKETSGEREPRLQTLLARIQDDDRTSFKFFGSAAELEGLLVADLAVLLAERFDQSRASSADSAAARQDATGAPLPEPPTRLIGRGDAVEQICALMREQGARLVTLTGPGGIGKSRLALAVAAGLGPEFPDGAALVPLAAVSDAEEVPAAVAEALGVGNTGDRPVEEKLATALQRRRFLLVLDNFEHVLEAAPVVARLLAAAPGLVVLATSRAPLALSGEHRWEVAPLELPRPSAPRTGAIVPAVQLFVERARSVRPDFALTAENRADVERIVLALDGLPLAIELAAARIRLLSPGELLRRLDRPLSLLAGGARDLPARQRTLRATLDWSTQLLTEEERQAFARLGAFAGWFRLEAVEHLLRPDGLDGLTVLGSLLDNSLIHQEERGGRAAFLLLRTVREYALERLEERGAVRETLDRHADYFAGLGIRMQQELDGRDLPSRLRELTDQHDDLRATARHLLDTHQWDRLTGFVWSLFAYWWLGGHVGEVRDWMDEALRSDDPPTGTAYAIALDFTCAIGSGQQPEPSMLSGLRESVAILREAGWHQAEATVLISLAIAHLLAPADGAPAARRALGRSIRLFQQARDGRGEGMALSILGRVDLAGGELDAAAAHFAAAVELAEDRSDDFAATLALHDLATARALQGDLEGAEATMERSLRLSLDLDHQEGVAYGIEGFGGIAAARGDAERAGLLLGAAQTLRERIGRYSPDEFSFHSPAVARLRAAGAGPALDRALEEGRRVPVDDALGMALAAPAARPDR